MPCRCPNLSGIPNDLLSQFGTGTVPASPLLRSPPRAVSTLFRSPGCHCVYAHRKPASSPTEFWQWVLAGGGGSELEGRAELTEPTITEHLLSAQGWAKCF